MNRRTINTSSAGRKTFGFYRSEFGGCMDRLTLTMLDTSGIQSYIFNSNRLQENIGASELVYRARAIGISRIKKQVGAK